MKTSRLGSNGPELSVVGYGGWEAGGTAWGPNESDEGVIAAIRAALDAGISWIDSAEVYGDGVSERLVGRAIADRRDDVIVATKLAPRPEGSGFRPDEVRAGCDASLARLGVDAIDLYQLHWPDDDVPVDETWGAMGELVDAGKVRWIGVSNFDRPLIERCEAVRHVDSLQPEFSMLRREAADLIAWCGRQGTGVVSYGPLAFGLLTGAISASTTFVDGDWRASGGDDEPDMFDAALRPRMLAVVDRLRSLAEGSGITTAQLALAWNAAQPGVTSAIAGSRDPAHVRSNAEAGDVDLTEDQLEAIDAILADAGV
jgi:aryl-alcohol dehydrogenase-like predicted oxidoreductase